MQFFDLVRLFLDRHQFTCHWSVKLICLFALFCLGLMSNLRDHRCDMLSVSSFDIIELCGVFSNAKLEKCHRAIVLAHLLSERPFRKLALGIRNSDVV